MLALTMLVVAGVLLAAPAAGASAGDRISLVVAGSASRSVSWTD